MTNYLLAFAFITLSLIACEKDELPTGNGQTLSDLFQRTETPVFESPLDLAADPSILRSGDSLMMYYTAENMKIGLVISTDNGSTWSSPDGNENDDYAAFRGDSTKWDRTLETIDVLKVGSEFWMYYTGYIEGVDDNGGTISNYEIGLATSSNGVDFVRHPESIEKAIIARDVSNLNTNDRDALTSPGAVFDDGTFYMIYAGWNVQDNWTGPNAGIRILGATSADGVNWTKIETPLITSTDVTYSPDVNEASLLKDPDGFWYIPFSTRSSIGIARSTSFEGPYEVYQQDIVAPQFEWDSEVTAPDGLIEDGKMRLWFHGVKEPIYWPWVIGYSEADFPLDW